MIHSHISEDAVHQLQGKLGLRCASNSVSCIGKEKSQGHVGMYNYTGNDFGHKSVELSKEWWCNKYFSLLKNHAIVKAFGTLGTLPNEQCSLTDGELHKDIKALEEFMCMPYDKDGPYALPAL